MNCLNLITFFTLIEIVLSNTITFSYRTRAHSNRRNKLNKSALDREYREWAANRYKIVSYTTGGEECIDNCVNNECITGWDFVKKPCKKGTKHAPIFFTSHTQKKAVCLSKCGKFGWRYEWCLVTKEGHWDYCSSAGRNETEKEVYFTSDGKSRCEGACEYSTLNQQYQCTDIWGGKRQCEPSMKIPFVEAKTIYGDRCVGACYRYKADQFTMYRYQCTDINGYNEYCAPPAQKFSSKTKHLYKKLQTPMY